MAGIAELPVSITNFFPTPTGFWFSVGSPGPMYSEKLYLKGELTLLSMRAPIPSELSLLLKVACDISQ
jgi:hypothetical protein